MSQFKVLVTNYDVPKAAIDLLKRACDVIINEEIPYPTAEQIKAKAKGVDAIFWTTKYRLDQSILDAAGPQLKVIATMSAGVDLIDVPLLKSKGIKLANTPVVVNDATADCAILLALGAARRVVEGRKTIENGTWEFGIQTRLGQEIRGSTVGIIGLGEIGTTIAKRCKAFEPTKILYSGHTIKESAKELNAIFTPFADLIKESDFVFISCPLNTETRGLFKRETFAKMKTNSILVNIARGEIINQDDLIEALESKTIFAAGLDVMTPEPLPKEHKLLKLDNCFITPHIGSATQKTRDAMAILTAQNILRGLGGEEMFTPVY